MKNADRTCSATVIVSTSASGGKIPFHHKFRTTEETKNTYNNVKVSLC